MAIIGDGDAVALRNAMMVVYNHMYRIQPASRNMLVSALDLMKEYNDDPDWGCYKP